MTPGVRPGTVPIVMSARRNAEPAAGAFLALIEQRAPRPLSIQDMARMLGRERYDRKAIRAGLEAAVTARTIRRIGKTRYQWIRDRERRRPQQPRRAPGHERAPHGRAAGRIEGRYSRVRAGYGFVEVLGRGAERFARDILVPQGMEGDALHGDRVEVEIVRRDPRTQRTVGRVIAVTGRVHERIIGTLDRRRDRWWLLPENELLPAVEITGRPTPAREEAGLIALVRLTRMPAALRGPAGEIDRVLGAADDPEVQFLGIAYEHGLRIEFPPEVVEEAEALPSDPSASDCADRRDLRALPFVTIDGETARDFDDAVCLEPMEGGGGRLFVAIADVSHYVRPGSALDAEVARRGTSVYFPDRAIPMLPPRLSNQLCSLNPRRDRLTLVAELSYDRGGRRRDARFYRAVIRSQARLTYTKVAAVLSDADTADIHAWRTDLGPLVEELRRMHALMTRLYRRRMQAGSLDLDLPEALIDLSEEGRSVGVRLFRRNDAHRLIEEFMLEANCAVAMFLTELGIPFPYRVHEPPDPAAIDELNQFLQAFGFHVSYEGRVRPQDLQGLLDQLLSHRLARVLSRHVLRSLKQAQYSTINARHFGLAFDTYCHFTSPIRRYPDLLVHRQLGRVLDDQLDRARVQGEALEAASVQSSQAEREAMEAERAMLDLKKAEFMLEHLLEAETGTIVSVASFGFFVELDAYPIEGLVRADGLEDDRYSFVERELALKGMRTGQRFKLGDRVVVEAFNVSLRRRQIDFRLLRRLAPADQQPARAGKRKRSPSPPRRRKAG